MSCEELRDLLPAYALGILEPDEHAAVEAHLASCREHEADLVDLRATTLALDLLREEPAASPALHERIAAITPPRPSEGYAGAPSVLRPRWWLAAAAAVALLAVFASGWATHALLDGDGSPASVSEVRYAYALQGGGGEFVGFTGIEGAGTVTVTMAGLDRLPDDQRYRLWAIRDGQWLRIGQCNTNAQGGWRGDFDFALAAGEQLAVTIERTAADPQPPGDPILRTGS
ncbi:MAG: anti-sigma factor [Dehalococcoidia bacterium]